MIDKATADKARAELDHALRAYDDVRDVAGFVYVGHKLWLRAERKRDARWALWALDESLRVALSATGRPFCDVLEADEWARCVRIVKRVAPTVLEAMLEDAGCCMGLQRAEHWCGGCDES